MKAHNIRIRADRLNFPLDECFVGKLSSAVFVIYGDIPDDIEAMTVQISRIPDPETHQPRENYTVAANPVEGCSSRCFRAYMSPFLFPDVSSSLEYFIIGVDRSGNARWLGTGALIVMDNPANGSPVSPEIISADTYIRNPVTGLYHKLVAEVNEFGEVSVSVDSEGIQR